MIKGCSKRMIVLKSTGSEVFDEAYFVLKPRHAESSVATESDFIAEARRIVGEAAGEKTAFSSEKLAGKMRFFAGFLCGALLGSAAACFVIWLI